MGHLTVFEWFISVFKSISDRWTLPPMETPSRPEAGSVRVAVGRL